MIKYIEGILYENDGKENITVNVNGIFFDVRCTKNLILSLPPLGQSILVPTFLFIKEDNSALFGFKDAAERDFFNILITVQGVGPKSALNILSGADLAALHQAILMENAKLLSAIPGIGKKSAERLILELKDKVKDIVPAAAEQDVPKEEYDAAVSGLMNLGCTPNEASELVNFIIKREGGKKLNAEQLIVESLKHRGR